MIPRFKKTPPEIARIRYAARIVTAVLSALEPRVMPGCRPVELDAYSEALILQAGGTPCMKGYAGFPTATAVSVNAVAAHGVPDGKPLQSGDLVSVDVAVDVQGWKADGAWTYLVPGAAAEDIRHQRQLIRTAWQCVIAGVAAARPHHRTGDIGARIRRHAAKEGFIVLPRFTGHGVGRELHEGPLFHYAADVSFGSALAPGMVFTVEPVLGSTTDLALSSDGFGFRTADGSLTAQFEVTIAVLEEQTEILTLPGLDLATHAAYPPSLEQL